MEITHYIARRREALLIGDYNAYRAQLSRQLLAIRKRLGLATAKRDKFAKRTVTAEDVAKSREYVYLLLLIAERAWAHAMHIKTSHTEDSKGITGTTRSHIISRLHKAAKIAAELVALLKSQSATDAGDRDVLEARAYQAALGGAEEFEKQSEGQRGGDAQPVEQRWQKCLHRYSEARVIYAALLEQEKKEVYRELLANTIDPTIRYAAYQARLSRTVAISTVAKRYFPSENKDLVAAVEKLDPFALKDKPAPRSEDASTSVIQAVPDSVSWRGRKANIVDASIGQAMANVTAAEARLRAYLAANAVASTREKAAAYDDVLIASQDAADATKRATDELEKERVDEGDPRMQNLRVTSLALNYELVSWRVGRNRILIGEDDGMTFEAQRQKKPKRLRKDGTEYPEKDEPRGRKLARLRERVVLYDSITQSLESVRDLRGAMRDAAFISELDGKTSYFRALKCLNISYSHSLLGNHLNALTLLKRAQDLASKARSDAASEKQDAIAPRKSDIQPTASKTLQAHVTALLSRTHALVEMHKLEENAAIAAAKNMTSAAPLIQHLTSYPTPGTFVDLKNLVTYPPKIEPVPVKPLFLDVAWNYIEYPGRRAAPTTTAASGVVVEDEKMANGVEEQPQPQQQEKKRGWFGFGR